MNIKRLTACFRNALISTIMAAILLTFSNVKTKAEIIALSVPLSGDFADIGRNFSTGAKLAMEKLGSGHELFIVDDGCESGLAKFAAQDLQTKPIAIVTGMLCNDVAQTFANELRDANIPLLINGARSSRLIKDREREDWNLWRMSPGDDAPAEIFSKIIVDELRDKPFAIVDDGTVYGRSMTDAIRLRLNEADVRPQFADTFRAAQSTQAGLLRRLERSGVAVAIIASSSVEDLVTITRNLQELDIKIELITTEQLAVLPFLENPQQFAKGTKVIMQSPSSTLEATQSLTTLLVQSEIRPDEAIYQGYAAIETALAALGDTSEQTIKNLENNSFQTIVGIVKFNPDGSNMNNPYKPHIWLDDKLTPVSQTNDATQ